jgi:alpha-beta hydrolase superfamily lysophospholipase
MDTAQPPLPRPRMTDSTQAPFTLRDGLNIALYDWPLPLRWRPRAVVLIVHGLGEHAWRYDILAQRLNQWGFCVRAFDQRGHGESGGARGVLPDDDALLDDLAEVLADTRRHLSEPWACPLILLGHSMGGLVAASFVQREIAPVDGLVLSSPALDAGIGPLQRKLMRLLYRWAPNLSLPNGLDPGFISHDAAQVQAYRADRLVHDRISARLAFFIDSNGPHVVAAAPSWSVPTLLLYAGADRLVRPEGSRGFAAVAPPQRVQSHCLQGQFHEIFNEADPSLAYSTLQQWLDGFAPAP